MVRNYSQCSCNQHLFLIVALVVLLVGVWIDFVNASKKLIGMCHLAF